MPRRTPQDNTPQQPVQLPEDLSARHDDGAYAVPDEQIATLHERAQAEFDALYESGVAPDAAGLARANELVDMIEELRAEETRRGDEREAAAAELEELRARVHPEPVASAPDEPDGDDDEDEDAAPDAAEGAPQEPTATGEPQPEAIEGEVVEAREPALVAGTRRTIPVDRQRLAGTRRSLNQHLRDQARRGPSTATRSGYDPAAGRNVSLRQASRFAPDPRVPTTPQNGQVLVAAGDIPNYRVGTPLASYRELADAVVQRGRSLPDSEGKMTRYQVAYLERDHTYRLDEKATPEQWNEVLTAATDPEVLVAAGGWCAPPTTSYDFFNVVCEDGLLDLPTVGVPRGSMQWPVSPSFGDIMGLDDNPWTWSNQDDIDALGTNPPTKPCQRIPCPTLDDAELSCDGICLTVGNLFDYAWPEAVENHTRLLMAAQTHYMNTRKIAAMVAGSTAVTVSVPGTDSSFIAPLLSGLDLQAWDLREKYRMCEDAVLEAILPRWVVGMTAADLGLRQGLSVAEAFNVSLASLANWLDQRNIRAQFVSDWQIGSAGQLGGATAATAWPTTVQALIYSPGTWVLGQGLRLNLGVIRDSVLNETNDFTAAWMEECYLVAKIGHESRVVTVPVCASGGTNAGDVLACGS